jgi:Ca2+-transporting ATPase
MVAWSIFQGGVAFSLLATVFLLKTSSGMPETLLRAFMFFALVAEIIALIFVNRSFSASISKAILRPNTALRNVMVTIVAITGLILFLPKAQALLRFGTLSWVEMVHALGIGAMLLLLLEGCKVPAQWLTASGVEHDNRDCSKDENIPTLGTDS